MGNGLPLNAKIYVALISLMGVAATAIHLVSWRPEFSIRFILYLAVSLVSSGLKVTLPGVKGTMSVNYAFVLLGLLDLKQPEVMFMALLAAIAQSFWHAKVRPKFVQLVFNVSSFELAVIAASYAYGWGWLGTMPGGQLLQLGLAATVYFLVNTVSVATVLALIEKRQIVDVWRNCYFWSFPYYLVGASLAEMVHLSVDRLGWAFTLALLPVLFMIYRSYRLYLGKLQQEKTHAEEMAALHLRTIEALALAIEAKDECTHEHLRRVQVYSVEVGKRLGLDPGEIQALQAASILHDIGKLAVPDYIISKPGKLTPEEFEKIKIHPVIGGAILDRVGFPYPVAPIVRSHHEKWDGTGYPSGLKGEEIPIGARILAAVDCLDALASDRPYRRALPLDEAIAYIAAQSGKSFDPKVVQVLHDYYTEFESTAQLAPLRKRELDKNIVVERGNQPAAGFENAERRRSDPSAAEEDGFLNSIASARQEMQTILELTQDLSGSLRVEEMLAIVAERLKRLVPFDGIAVYLKDGDVLAPAYVSGENSRLFGSLRIPFGQGLSGWVVENAKPIINGNPSVEPGCLNDPTKFSTLHSALSVPLHGATEIIGAMSVYHLDPDAYSKDHLRILLAINTKMSRAIESSIKLQQAQERANTDGLTGLPNASALFLQLEAELVRCSEKGRPLAVFVCDLDGFKAVNDRFGHLTGNLLLQSVAKVLQENCRDTDYVARMGGDEFVLLLPGARPDELTARITRIDQLVRRAAREVCPDAYVAMSVGAASFPANGKDSETLLSQADKEMYWAKRARKALQLANPNSSAEDLQAMSEQLLPR